tara:strand:- start:606 stop:4388 length:3783 start_codon:yes stop_codon:yes gene_type:complete
MDRYNSTLEPFDTMTRYDNILSDISTNPFPTPDLDKENNEIKKQLDDLINRLKDKKKEMHKLELKINKESLTAALRLKDDTNYSGKNIFFSSMDPIGIFDLLRPIGIISDYGYTQNNLLGNNITLEQATILTNDIPDISQSTGGFEKSLYYLAMGPSELEKIDSNAAPLITIPLKIVAPRGAPLLNRIKSAATTMSSIKYPESNYNFRFHVQPESSENLTPLEKKALSDNPAERDFGNRTKYLKNPWDAFREIMIKEIPDFNLSYKSSLPIFLQSANFLSVGYNGYVYVGIDVEIVNMQTPTSFLDVLIRTHNAANDPLQPYAANIFTKVSLSCKDKCDPEKNNGLLLCLDNGYCASYANENTGQEGFYYNSPFYGNQSKKFSIEYLRMIESQLKQDIIKNNAYISSDNNKIKADLFMIDQWIKMMNTGAISKYMGGSMISGKDGEINFLQKLTAAEKDKIINDQIGIDTLKQITSIVYLGCLLGADGNILGPPLGKKKISDVFSKGGLLPVKYRDCFQDSQYKRLLDISGPQVATADECFKIANDNGYHTIGLTNKTDNNKKGQCRFSKQPFDQYKSASTKLEAAMGANCPWATQSLYNKGNTLLAKAATEKAASNKFYQEAGENWGYGNKRGFNDDFHAYQEEEMWEKRDESIGNALLNSAKGFLNAPVGMCTLNIGYSEQGAPKGNNGSVHCNAGIPFRPIGGGAKGGYMSSAVYQNNFAPQQTGCVFYIAGFNDANAKQVGVNPGSILYTYRVDDKINIEVVWENPSYIDKELLRPYPQSNVNVITSITNSDRNNSAYGSNSEETLNYIWGNDPSINGEPGKHRYLYSNDMYFKLDLNSTMNKTIKKESEELTNKGKSHQNIDDYLKKKTKQPYQNFFNYSTTGVKCNLITDIDAMSKGDINSRNPLIEKVFNLLVNYQQIIDTEELNKTINAWNLVYTIDPIDTKLLGRVGFIEYDDKDNTEKNPYNIQLYPENKIKNIGEGPSKFVETPGTLQRDKLAKHPSQPSFSFQPYIYPQKHIVTHTDCAKACYNSLNECQAYEFTKKNECLLLKSKTNYITQLLKAQDPGVLSQNQLKFNLRVPDIMNTDTCPNTINDTLVTSTLPSDFGTTKFSNIKYDKYNTNAYYKINEVNDIPLCNIGKIINTDEQQLKQYQDEIIQIANDFDSLVSSLESKEGAIYREIFNKQKEVEEDYKTFETMHLKIKEQDKSVPDTLKANVENSTIHLMSSNTNFIIWTIVAIGIIILAIHLSRNLKKK